MTRECLLLLGLVVGGWSLYQQPPLAVQPKGYRVDLNPVPEEGIFKGRVRIDVVNRGTEPITELRLNYDPQMTVSEKEVAFTRLANEDLSDEESDEETENVSLVKVEKVEDNLVLRLSSKLQRDVTYQIDIKFEGKLLKDNTRAIYQDSYYDKNLGEARPFIVLSPALGQANQVFPCFNTPFYKSWFELSVSHKRGFTALSNTPVIEQSNVTNKEGWIRSQFARTPLMAVHSLGLFISDFKMPQVDYLQTDGIKMGLWGRSEMAPSLSKAQQLLPSVLVTLELYLSRPYPLQHLNLIALPGYIGDRPKNSWGIQWFKESDLINGNTYWLTHRIAKASAMQWLSHLASPVNDSCVTTGLAHFLAGIVAKQLEPSVFSWNLGSFHTLVLELGKTRNYGLDSEQIRSLMEIKVSLFLQMLDQVFSAGTFKQSIQNFLAKKEFKSYSDDDLWQVITEQAWVDNKLSPSLTLNGISKQWLKKRIPLVSASTDYKTNSTVFTQEEFSDGLEFGLPKVVKKGGAEKQDGWWIPLVMTQGSSDPAVLGWLSPDQHSASFSNASATPYMVVNPGSAGPYLVNYDNEGWRRLSGAFQKLPVQVRAQILHDSLILALSGHLSTVTALDVTYSLRKEQSPEVWKTFFPLAERLRKRFQGTSASKNLDAYLKTLLIPVLDALGEEDKSLWKTDLRVKTRHLLCEAGFTPCIDNARQIFASWINASQPDDGIPIASSHLCPVMAWGTFDEWEFAFNRLINFPSNRSKIERTFLMKTVAGCPQDSKKYETLLNVTFLDEAHAKTFTDDDKFVVLSAIAGESIGYNTLFNFLKNNWSAIKNKLQSNLWEFFVQTALGNFRTEEGLKQVTELLNEKKADLGVATKAAEDSVARVQSRVKWAKESAPAVEEWLNKTLENSWIPQRFKFQDVIVVSHTDKQDSHHLSLLNN